MNDKAHIRMIDTHTKCICRNKDPDRSHGIVLLNTLAFFRRESRMINPNLLLCRRIRLNLRRNIMTIFSCPRINNYTPRRCLLQCLTKPCVLHPVGGTCLRLVIKIGSIKSMNVQVRIHKSELSRYIVQNKWCGRCSQCHHRHTRPPLA